MHWPKFKLGSARRGQKTKILWILPLELTEVVIDFLHADKPSLLACALVQHSWLDPSRYHLFRKVVVVQEKAFDPFVSFLHDTPQITRYIRVLYLSGPPKLVCGSDSLMSKRPFVCCHLLIDILQSLPQLREIYLTKVRFKSTHQYAPRRRANLNFLSRLLAPAPQTVSEDVVYWVYDPHTGLPIASTKPPAKLDVINFRCCGFPRDSIIDFMRILSVFGATKHFVCTDLVQATEISPTISKSLLSKDVAFASQFLHLCHSVEITFLQPYISESSALMLCVDFTAPSWHKMLAVFALLHEYRSSIHVLGILPGFIKGEFSDLARDWKLLHLHEFSNMREIRLSLDFVQFKGVDNEDSAFRSTAQYPLKVLSTPLPSSLQEIVFYIRVKRKDVHFVLFCFLWSRYDTLLNSLPGLCRVTFRPLWANYKSLKDIGLYVRPLLPLLDRRGLLFIP